MGASFLLLLRSLSRPCHGAVIPRCLRKQGPSLQVRAAYENRVLIRGPREVIGKQSGNEREVKKVNEILSQIGNYGFPMVVAAYLLVRIEKKLDDLTAAIVRLGEVINRGAA